MEEASRKKGRKKMNHEEVVLTFFGVGWCILTGMANHPVEVPGSVLQHVIPGRHKIHISNMLDYIIKLY